MQCNRTRIMPLTVDVEEVEKRFLELVDLVEAGEEVLIARNDALILRMSPARSNKDLKAETPSSKYVSAGSSLTARS